METNKLFEYASRNKLRFNTSKGVLSTEDLWDLSLESLNIMAKSLNKQMKANEEEDFINSSRRTKSEMELEYKFELVKYVIKVKLEEKDKREKAAAKRSYVNRSKSKLMEAEDKELNSKSAEELRAQDFLMSKRESVVQH